MHAPSLTVSVSWAPARASVEGSAVLSALGPASRQPAVIDKGLVAGAAESVVWKINHWGEEDGKHCQAAFSVTMWWCFAQ